MASREVQPRRRPATFQLYDYICRNWIAPFAGDARVEYFGVREVEWLYATVQRERKNGKGKMVPGATIRVQALIHSTLRAAFAQAVRWGMLDRNPCGGDLIEAPQYQAAERSALTAKQSQDLIDAARASAFGAIVLPLATGMRPGEVFGLLWEHV